ncbi:FBP domain-containing protein [Modestobacter sp. I12A-02628]|uniref:FBP domain-containing protein n=1 Tax=Goekera deserti TaxID=2497753 RepID=A0A7K3WDZ6_9ACTN|nr:FBP domain-containing protein [Goekera deserti]MPQ99555.1 FBP domain-containing protein [Goekera deserti]NDI46433.1 FBP domain-containing protein [Goekera deserti]NEL54634.1 FBP domain-containing protein [Goekera deserti]
MRALTEKEIRRSFVNCSRSEAAGLTLPRDLDDVPWEDREYLGWRDPKAPLRGYAVLWHDDGPVGIALRAAESSMSSRTAAMCLLCQSTLSGGEVSLFTARRSGPAGRNGDTVGQYICADLQCSQRIRSDVPPWLRDRDPAEVVPQLAGDLLDRIGAFVGHVVDGQ